MPEESQGAPCKQVPDTYILRQTDRLSLPKGAVAQPTFVLESAFRDTAQLALSRDLLSSAKFPENRVCV